MKIWRPDLFIVFGSLVLGSLIYIIARSEAIVLNHYVAGAADGEILTSLQGLISNDNIPSWVIYSLPDGLWMLALATSIMMIWHYELNYSSIVYTVVASISGVMFEILQGLSLIPGTFDWSDIFFVTAASVLPVSVTILKSRLCKK